MTINLYEEMNEKISDIIAIGGSKPDLYASAYIKHLRQENQNLKSAKQLAETQLKELLSALYQRADSKEGFILYRKDIVKLANDYGYKEEELK